MSRHRSRSVTLVLCGLALAACAGHDAAAQSSHFALGRPATAGDIAAERIDVPPDGTNLPPGAGTATDGEHVFAARCASCHGTGGIALAGGIGSLAGPHPIRTVGSYWPYATTLFDYIRRAMPPARDQPLSPSDLYAVTAFVLAINGIVGPHEVIGRTTLPNVAMPNVHGFASPPP